MRMLYRRDVRSVVNLANQFHPVPKPSHSRTKKTAKQRGYISSKVRQAVDTRSQGRCEWCGWYEGQYDPTGRKWGLQKAHLRRRWKLEETTEHDIANLCGPSVNTNTCHWKVDYTEEGRRWAEQFRERLMQG